MGEGDATQAASEHEPSTASTPEAELAPTTRIGRYEIERRLGAGGMGVVYAAHDIHLRRSVALKLVAPRNGHTVGQDRLVREAQAMAKLRHPNLATVHDIGVSGDRLFVVMELVDGGTAAEWLAAQARSWREIVALYLQAARGLAAAHDAGFVHLDFKPENVLVGSDGVARVSDFGVARLLGEAEPTKPAIVGTAGYIAPEILRGQVPDHRADQFSFCVALYAALHGERPFERDGPRGITETLGPIRSSSSRGIPRWLDAIIDRGLATDPEHRWPAIAALASAIDRRMARRVRTRISIVAAMLAATVAIGIAVVVRTPNDPPLPPDWAPVVIGRDSEHGGTTMEVSRDGSTVVALSQSEAWVEPRAGNGPRRRLAYPGSGNPARCRLSHRGDELVCALDASPGFEIWAVDAATGRAERRVPPSAMPSLKANFAFDVGPDGSIVFGAVDLAAVWRVDPRGAVARVATAQPGEQLVGPVWSPDGTRIALKVRSADGIQIEVLDVETGAAVVASRLFCKELEWLTDDSLACAPLTLRRPVVIELRLSDGTEHVRYSGPEYQMLTGLAVSSAGVSLSTAPVDQHLALVALDASRPVESIDSTGITDLPATGWTTSGALIFGANVRGHLQVMARRPDGAIETLHAGTAAEVPLAVFGETIVFGRFPGGESTIPFFEAPLGRRYPDGELFSLEPGGVPRSLGPTHAFHALLCASTCLLAERSGGDVIAVDWDRKTGARGRQRARWSSSSFPGSSALSPDLTTLVQVQRKQGSGALSFLDLATGARHGVSIAPWESIDWPTWHPDGTLVAQASSDDEGRWIVRVRESGSIEKVCHLPPVTDDEVRISPDGKLAAILTMHAVQTHWWVARD